MIGFMAKDIQLDSIVDAVDQSSVEQKTVTDDAAPTQAASEIVSISFIHIYMINGIYTRPHQFQAVL